MPSKIEWTDETWNPVTGCTKISAGCKNCYAERMSKRLAGRFGYPEGEPFEVSFHADKLEQPLRWKKPRRIFVCSMGDLFHNSVPDVWIFAMFKTMAQCQHHTFQILTKRPARMADLLELWIKIGVTWVEGITRIPLPNVHIGVTCENQAAADERIPLLLQTPAAKRFVSIEPMLGPISLNLATDCDKQCNEHQEAYCPGTVGKCIGQMDLDQVIVGAETGPGKRFMDNEWAMRIRNQCQAAEVPFFFKKDSDGEHTLSGKTWEEAPSG